VDKCYYISEGLKCFPKGYFITGVCTTPARSKVFFPKWELQTEPQVY